MQIHSGIWEPLTQLILPLLHFNFSLKLLSQWSFQNKKPGIMYVLTILSDVHRAKYNYFQQNPSLSSSLPISSPSSFPTFFRHTAVNQKHNISFLLVHSPHSLCLEYSWICDLVSLCEKLSIFNSSITLFLFCLLKLLLSLRSDSLWLFCCILSSSTILKSSWRQETDLFIFVLLVGMCVSFTSL